MPECEGECVPFRNGSTGTVFGGLMRTLTSPASAMRRGMGFTAQFTRPTHMPVRVTTSDNHLRVLTRIALLVAFGDWLTKAVAARVVGTDAVVLTERLRFAVV